MKNLLNAMAIVRIGTKQYHYTCPVRDCEGADKDMMIPKFPSTSHARDKGWIFTDDMQFCPPDEEIVAVCPDCVDRLGSNEIK